MYIDGDAGKVAIINCCEHEFSIATDTSAGSNPLNPVQQWYAIQDAKKQADHVIVIVHGGHEHYQLPSPRMVELYRYFVDCGADAVVNHHQHCYSGYEYYNEKPIVYGLGNFLFDNDTKRNDIWNEGFMLNLCLDKKPEISLVPYIQCDDSPSVRLIDNTKPFEEIISNLCSVISDSKLLKEKHEEWMRSSMVDIQLIFSPYSNKYLKAACARKLIPSFVTKNKAKLLYNYIACEAHNDRVLSYLSSKLL